MKHLALVAALALAPLAGAHGQPASDDFSRVPLAELKARYLACDRAATRTVLDPGTAVTCSNAAEALLERGFGGDFDRLIAWWRSEKDGAAGGPQAAARPKP